MGRDKRDAPQGKFILKDVNWNNIDTPYQVYMQYTWNGKVIKKRTEVKVCPKDWNKKGNRRRGELRQTFGYDYKIKNADLTERLNRIDANLVEYERNHKNNLTVEIVKAIVNEEPITRRDEGKDFVDFALERLKSKYTLNRIGYSRYKNGCSALKIFGEFLLSKGLGTHKPNGIYVGEITCELLLSHIEWRKTVKQNSDATINHSLTPILDACNYACELGYVKRATNANLQLMRIDLKRSIDEDSREYDGRSLTKEQLDKLIEYYDKCEEPRRKEFIEMFLFAFHACGLRVADVMTLQWSSIDFKEKELSKVLVKTKNRHKIPLNDAAIAILKRWRKKSEGKRFVFDLVNDDLNLKDDDALYKARNNATKCINQSLAVVGKQMELTFTLTMHVARHTFAVLALNHTVKKDDGKEEKKPMQMSILSRLLGHASTDTTEKVYAKFLPETLEKEVEDLHFNFLPSFD